MNYIKKFNSWSDILNYIDKITEVYSLLGLTLVGYSVNYQNDDIYKVEVAVRKR